MQDLVAILIEKAKEAKKDKDTSTLSEEAFQNGYLAAWHEVIDIMKSQAHAFLINENEIGLADINPDNDLS